MQHSKGFLPLAPLLHSDPTSVGVCDLDGSLGIRHIVAGAAQGARDQLVLARLHEQPVAIVHLAEPPANHDRDSLITTVWREAEQRIVQHAKTCGCMPTPHNAAEFRAALDADDGRCAGRIPPRPEGKAAVILCTIGRDRVLERSLETLSQMSCEDFEIVVVDNRPSVRGTRAIVERFASEGLVRYVTEPRPGLAVARNTGVACATDAAYVAFADDDEVVDRHWLSWLLAPFVDSRVDAVTGLVMPLSLQSGTEKRFERYAGFGKGVDREVYDMAQHRASDRFLYPYWGGMFGSGNSMAFRRGALLAVGGFDAALGAGTPTGGGEDIAAFSDVVLAGGRLVYEPRSICWHEHRGDEASLRTQVRNYGVGLTAVFWRYFVGDWRFTTTLLRSLSKIVQLTRSRQQDRQADTLPTDLARLELRGRLLGPWLYMASSRQSKRSEDVAQ